jgi:hypothetical protein
VLAPANPQARLAATMDDLRARQGSCEHFHHQTFGAACGSRRLTVGGLRGAHRLPDRRGGSDATESVPPNGRRAVLRTRPRVQAGQRGDGACPAAGRRNQHAAGRRAGSARRPRAARPGSARSRSGRPASRAARRCGSGNSAGCGSAGCRATSAGTPAVSRLIG